MAKRKSMSNDAMEMMKYFGEEIKEAEEATVKRKKTTAKQKTATKKKSEEEERKEPQKKGGGFVAIEDVFGGDTTPWSCVLFEILVKAKNLNLRRQGDTVMVPHETITGVFVTGDTAADFINETCAAMPEYHHKSVSTKKVLTWFENQDHPLFPMITAKKTRTDVIAFKNGYFN